MNNIPHDEMIDLMAKLEALREQRNRVADRIDLIEEIIHGCHKLGMNDDVVLIFERRLCAAKRVYDGVILKLYAVKNKIETGTERDSAEYPETRRYRPVEEDV